MGKALFLVFGCLVSLFRMSVIMERIYKPIDLYSVASEPVGWDLYTVLMWFHE